MTTRRRFVATLVALPVLGLTLGAAHAASADVFITDGMAIRGYDPVAYFKAGKPVEGQDTHALKWMGANWRFSSAENMATFEADPHRYAPRYGGYCAYALAQGYIATSVPAAWTIHQGSLYLNYSKRVRRRWQKDKDGYIALADGNWPAVLNS